MLKLNQDQAGALLRLLSNPDFRLLCELLQDKQDELTLALRQTEGAELFRCQGRAQALQDVLDLEAQVTTPPKAMAQQSRPADYSFGQRDNPHFAKP